MLSRETLLEVSISRFRALRQRYGHLPRQRRTPESIEQFRMAQVEMFHLAQVICGLVNPALQLELDTTRREIMQQIDLNIKVPTGARVVTKRTTPGQLTWYEYQITPEISVDPTITGNAVLFPLLRRLRVALRTQVGLVNTKTCARP
jgi:hypothetical protein